MGMVTSLVLIVNILSRTNEKQCELRNTLLVSMLHRLNQPTSDKQ